MANQRLLNNGIRVAAALALVVAVMSSPIRPMRATNGARSDHFLRNFVMPKGGSGHHRSPAPPLSRVLQVKALHAESEDKPRGTAGRATFLFLPPPALSSFVAHRWDWARNGSRAAPSPLLVERA